MKELQPVTRGVRVRPRGLRVLLQSSDLNRSGTSGGDPGPGGRRACRTTLSRVLRLHGDGLCDCREDTPPGGRTEPRRMATTSNSETKNLLQMLAPLIQLTWSPDHLITCSRPPPSSPSPKNPRSQDSMTTGPSP